MYVQTLGNCTVSIAILCCTLGAAAFSLITDLTNRISLLRTNLILDPRFHSRPRPLVNQRFDLIQLGSLQ